MQTPCLGKLTEFDELTVFDGLREFAGLSGLIEMTMFVFELGQLGQPGQLAQL